MTREEAIEFLEHLVTGETDRAKFSEAIACLKKPEIKTRWIKHMWGRVECPRCNLSYDQWSAQSFIFCPGCGKKMAQRSWRKERRQRIEIDKRLAEKKEE